jgi:hypothetical protein
MGSVENTPFSSLGNALRALRLMRKESILEVSSAVEVTGERLALFENGELRPSEDVLELLISHYCIGEHEADKLWELAGYKRHDDTSQVQTQQAFMITPIDNRIIYTDTVHVMVNNYGVVMNFMQTSGSNNQPVTVSRIGMSREHAESVLQVLKRTLTESENTPGEPKRLDAPDVNQKPE